MIQKRLTEIIEEGNTMYITNPYSKLTDIDTTYKPSSKFNEEKYKKTCAKNRAKRKAKRRSKRR
jgi:hypothetical protein